MQYRYSVLLADHWHTLASMLEHSYNTPEYVNDLMILGLYVHKSGTELKEKFRSEGLEFNKLIVYQTEPLVENHWWKIQGIIKNLEGFDEVWDYDFQNIEVLKQYGIEAKFKPPMKTDSLKRITNSPEPEIDLLFYGSFTPYRQHVIDEYFNGCPVDPGDHIYGNMNFVWLYNIADKKLDDWIGRSKIILNLNPYDGDTRQQQTRIFYALMNNKCVLSQRSPINYFGDSIVEFHGLLDLKNKLNYLLTNDTWKQYTNKFKYFNNKESRSNVALFFDVMQLGDWQSSFEYEIFKSQQSGLFDTADYIHINVSSGTEPMPFTLHKTNRLTYGDVGQHIELFKSSCPNYSVIRVNTIDGTTSAV